MNVDGVIFADDQLIDAIRGDQCLQQVINVACMPGIVRASFAMPDIHWGYGFPIGGVAAFDLDRGVVSPGGVGYDINCGVRLLRTPLLRAAAEPQLDALIEGLFAAVPAGVGTGRRDLRLSPTELGDVAEIGVKWAVDAGFGGTRDLDYIEAQGRIAGADFEQVS
ncbi:MAG: RtcB family protein, partial [Myxococcales bacterium]|nr:RtcB family protein [Myxococcales bacterium]